MGKLDGRNALITGGSRGLGREIARSFIREGAKVYIVARSGKQLYITVQWLKQFLPESVDDRTAVIVSHSANVKSQALEIIHSAIMELGCIDILVNNAGIHGSKGKLEDTVILENEWDNTMSVNFFGPARLMCHVIPHMQKQGHGKIINISGGGATKAMYGLSAYSASKAALVRLTECVALEQMGTGIDVNAIAPGALNTRLMDDLLQAGPEKIGDMLYQEKLKQKETGGDSMQRAADLCVYLASDISNGITGRLISAQWDDWENMHRWFPNEDSDLYRLRRQVTR